MTDEELSVLAAELGRAMLVQHLVATGVLAAVSGVLVLGNRAERQLGTRRFQALITSFDTQDVYVVKDVANFFEVGQLEPISGGILTEALRMTDEELNVLVTELERAMLTMRSRREHWATTQAVST